MCEKLHQHLRAFTDTFKFRQQQKTTEAFNKDPEDFSKINIRSPVNVNNDITSDHPCDEADVPYPAPEYRVPSVNVSSQDTQCDAVEAVDHDFLDPRPQVKFIDCIMGSDEDPQ